MIGNDENIDLERVDTQFEGIYERGVAKGLAEAQSRDMTEFYNDGVEYGRQWGLQCGYQAGFLAYLDELSQWKPSKKVSDTMSQIKKMTAESTMEKSVEEIDLLRGEITKKFKILMRLLQISQVQKPIKEEEGLDF